ncbi:MAG: NAD(P)H-dependent oxidoreductase [Bacteroidota bacterium]
MITIVIGTNRKNSISSQVANQYTQLFKDINTETEVIDLSELPADFTQSALYENSGKNEAFNVFRDKMLEATKFLFVVPEYNGSFPGVLKAFIDGLAFPQTFKNKIAAITGVSSGIQGGVLAMSHLTDTFNYLQMNILHLKPKLSGISKKMENGKVVDDTYLDLMKQQSRLLADF